MRNKSRGDRRIVFSQAGQRRRRRRAARHERWGRRLRGIRSFRRGVASFFLLIYLLILGDLTLLRFHQINPDYNLVPGRTIAFDIGRGGIAFGINIVGNIVATMPLGVLLPIALPRRVDSALRVALAAFLTSGLIELAQAWLGRRVADVDDLILNTLGGWLGYGLARAGRRWFRRRSESNTRATSLAGAHRSRGPTPL